MKITEENLKIVLAKSYQGDIENLKMESILSDSIDSLDMLDFYMQIEETYGIEIPDIDVDSLNTFNDLIPYIESKLK